MLLSLGGSVILHVILPVGTTTHRVTGQRTFLDLNLIPIHLLALETVCTSTGGILVAESATKNATLTVRLNPFVVMSTIFRNLLSWRT